MRHHRDREYEEAQRRNEEARAAAAALKEQQLDEEHAKRREKYRARKADSGAASSELDPPDIKTPKGKPMDAEKAVKGANPGYGKGLLTFLRQRKRKEKSFFMIHRTAKRTQVDILERVKISVILALTTLNLTLTLIYWMW